MDSVLEQVPADTAAEVRLVVALVLVEAPAVVLAPAADIAAVALAVAEALLRSQSSMPVKH